MKMKAHFGVQTFVVATNNEIFSEYIPWQKRLRNSDVSETVCALVIRQKVKTNRGKKIYTSILKLKA